MTGQTYTPSPKPAPKKPYKAKNCVASDKVARIPIKVVPTVEDPQKPDWIRVKLSSPAEVERIKEGTLRKQKALHRLRRSCLP